MLLAYVFLANYLVSLRYAGDLLRREFSRASVQLELQNSVIDSQISIGSLYSFVQKTGMVEVKESESIFASANQDAGFALTGGDN